MCVCGGRGGVEKCVVESIVNEVERRCEEKYIELEKKEMM